MYAKSFARKLLVLGFAFALAAAVPGQLLAQQAESMDMEVMGGGPPKGGNPPHSSGCDCVDPDDSHKVTVIVPKVNWIKVWPDLEICVEFDPQAQGFKTMQAQAYYSFVTNENRQKKITAKINGSLPTGVEMQVKAEDPDGSGNNAKSSGWVVLGGTAKTVVYDIKQQSAFSKTLDYKVGPKPGTSMLTPETKFVTVEYTLVDG